MNRRIYVICRQTGWRNESSMERHDGMRSNRSAGWRQLVATVLLVMSGGIWADVITYPAAQQLKPCPSRDNCVSSQERGSRYEIEPLRFNGSPREARDHLLRIIASRPGAKIVVADAEHIKVEFRTRWLRFVDDADFLIGNGVVEVRSASRLGYSDFGVNRKRIEEIRQAFSGN